MASPNSTPDPQPSISAAELRRRLLSSTPPPMASTGLTPAEIDALPGNGLDALARLRLPGQPASSYAAPPDASTGRAAMSAKVAALEGAGYGAPPAPVRPPQPAPSGYAGGTGSGVRGYASRSLPDDPASPDTARLKAENKELRQLLSEMKQLLQEASDSEQQYAARQLELQGALTERQRHIDELSSQLQSIEEQISSGALGPQQAVVVPKTRTELEEWADELEKDHSILAQERKKLEHERRQLREDEESSENQMRQMEVGMARERALMARQETELKRLSAEIQHELEIMQRGDVQLRDQMQKFQRRAQDVIQGKMGPGSPPPPGRR